MFSIESVALRQYVVVILGGESELYHNRHEHSMAVPNPREAQKCHGNASVSSYYRGRGILDCISWKYMLCIFKLLSRHVTGFHRQKILRDTDFRAKDNRMLSLHLRNGRLDADTGPCFDWHD
ncbi:unnamed protein product [Parnassius apollo]|uniref:(apollo) hypothetical protein n=1 Tax=Parnassius apollo TaxID=110799 RepID=A0A8S3WLJ2_PARAO|nr:unnamed protein product [Parnassius apollo]